MSFKALEAVLEQQHPTPELEKLQEEFIQSDNLHKLLADVAKLVPWTIKLSSFNGSDLEQLPFVFGKHSGYLEEFFKMVHSEDRDSLKSALVEAIEKNHRIEQEFRFERQSGNYYWVRWVGELKMNTNAQRKAIWGIFEDINDVHPLNNHYVTQKTATG